MPPLPRGTCLVCRRQVAMRNDGVTREHRPTPDHPRICRGSAMRSLETLEAEPDTVTEPERERRQEGERG